MRPKPGNTGIQFIVSAYSRDTSAKEQQKAHSHAARAAHARARRLRTIEYQASKAGQQPETPREVKDLETTTKGCDILALKADETEGTVLPSLLNLLSSDRRDPFSCFARDFEPIEHFLLDHCEFLLPLQ